MTRPNWITAAAYPGAPVRMHLLTDGRDVGDIRIQQLTESEWRVCAFLPGRVVINEGDTPKVEPEDSFLTDNPDWADDRFDIWVKHAREQGWRDFVKGDGSA